MSRRLSEKYRKRLAAESGGQTAAWGGRLSVALVYPNTYHQGMSNLGFQTVYEWFNTRDDALCERFFLPDPEDLAEYRQGDATLVSFESQRRMVDFDLVAFSISFENDYLNLPTLFDLAGLPLWRTERDARFPLVLCGGVCAFLNPEPLADIMDLFAVGEAEVILPALIGTLKDRAMPERRQILKNLAGVPGVYVPQFYNVAYAEDGRIRSVEAAAGLPQRVRRQWLGQLDRGQSRTCISTPETEFASMNLLEISRGCPRGCRFCAAGFIYLPFRQHSAAHLQQQVAAFGTARKRVGLVGAAVSDYQEFAALGEAILDGGGEVSVSSVRVDSIDEAQVSVLSRSGHKTLALAPEAGSQKMRDVINKGIDELQILRAVKLVAEGGIPNLKLYFMVGLPGESEEDIEAICTLTVKIRAIWEAVGRKRGKLGRLTLSVNPFVPKPFTPLQWAPMEARSSLEKKYRYLQRKIRPLPNVDLHLESLKSSELQAFLARGDRRAGQVLTLLSNGASLRKACRETGLDLDFYLSRERSGDEHFPWEVIDQGVARQHLWTEYRLALSAKSGQVCFAGCRRCGICTEG
jgi:radical SAM superfamily enzyme YgiQ (UPF0313 family)